MTSTASNNEVQSAEKTVKTNPFRQNFKEQLIRNKKLSIMLFILHLTAAPLAFINVIANFFNNEYEEFDEIILILAVISTALAALGGIIIAINSFDYLCKRSRVDMSLALPLSTNQKFFSDFLGGLTAYTVPFFAAEIIGLLITGLGFILCEGKSYVVYKEPRIFEFFEPVLPYYLQLIIGGFFIMLMIYILTVLVMTCCGSLFECIIYTAAANGIIPAIIACFTYLTLGDIYGVNYEDSFIKVITTTSPGGGVYGLAYAMTAFADIGDDIGTVWKEVFLWLLPFIGVTAVMLAGAFLLYRKRRAEQVGRPFAFKMFYYVILFSVLFCLISLFDGAGELSVGAFICCAVVFTIMEVVANRGFKRFWMSIVRFAAMSAAVLAVAAVGDATNGFGALYRVPSAGNVSSVEISPRGGRMEDYSIDFTVASPENIQRVIDIHKGELENYRQHHKEDSYYGNRNYWYIGCGEIEIEYHLKMGGRLVRRYNLTVDEYLKLLEIERTDEYKTVLADELSNRILRGFDDLKYFWWESPNSRKNEGTVSVYRDFTDSREFDRYTVPEDFGEKLAEAVSADILAETDEEFYRPAGGRFIINLGRIVSVYPHYKNTIAYLKSVDMLPSEEYDLTGLRNVVSNAEVSVSSPADRLKFKGYTEYGFDRYSSTLYESRYNGNSEYLKILRLDKVNYLDEQQILKKLAMLIENSSPRYITEESCYTLSVSGTEYVVPTEYTELAEQLYDYCYVENDEYSYEYDYPVE